MSYLDNLKTSTKAEYGGRRSVYEILSLNPNISKDYEIIKREYMAVDIGTVWIDDVPYTNYGQYKFIYEKTYAKEPKRSSGGSMPALNSYATFLTPHLIIDFSIMSIDDYRSIMKQHYSRNEFTVKCYDQIWNTQIKVKMYFATEQMAQLFTIAKSRFVADEFMEWVEVVGVRDYSVELIGTNNELDLVTVFYDYNAPLDSDGNPIYPNGIPVPNEAEEDVYRGEEIVIGGNSTFKDMPPSTQWKFDHWVDKDGQRWDNGLVFTVNNNITFYAVWKPTNEYTLSFNYGLSKPMTSLDTETGDLTAVYDKNVQYGLSIGDLPIIDEAPYEEDENTKEKYYPYENGAWYRFPVKDESVRVNSGDLYWLARNTIIYCLYDKKKFDVSYNTNYAIYSIPKQEIEYGGTVYLPNLYRDGYTLDDWYIDPEFTTRFRGSMPPRDITLHAKWVQNT